MTGTVATQNGYVVLAQSGQQVTSHAAYVVLTSPEAKVSAQTAYVVLTGELPYPPHIFVPIDASGLIY